MVFMNYYAEDGHPTNVNRAHGYIADAEGIVVCGECAVKDAMKQQNGYWDTNFSARLLDRAGYLPYEAAEGDDFCSDCDRDLEPRPGSRRPGRQD